MTTASGSNLDDVADEQRKKGGQESEMGSRPVPIESNVKAWVREKTKNRERRDPW